MKTSINCHIHGEVPFDATPDFIGDNEAVTLYCPRCAEAAHKTITETAWDHCRRIKKKYEEVRRDRYRRPEGGYTHISRELWFIIEAMLIDENLWEDTD